MDMRYRELRRVAAGLLFLGVAGCVDLDVVNNNSPDRARALADVGDIEQLIAGAFNSWWVSQSHPGIHSALSVLAFQHSQWAGNFSVGTFNRIPREEVLNSTAGAGYTDFSRSWVQNYRALSAVRLGIQAVDEGANLGANEARARAFVKFIQGLGHGSLALLYDQAFILDETVVDLGALELKPYNEVMTAALKYLDDAIAIAQQNTFTVPAVWMSRQTTSNELVGIAHAYKARFRTQVARNPDERRAADWPQVVADLDKAITGNFIMIIGGAFDHTGLYNGTRCRWSQQFNFLRGMADQSGAYQSWIATPAAGRTPFVWVTPDQRFPQGTTLDEQRASPGKYVIVPGTRGLACGLGDHFNSPAAGTWRWSNYRDDRNDAWIAAGNVGPAIEISQRELRLLRAEALYRAGDLPGAAAIIDETRIASGGLGTSLLNEDCVPRLPDGACGGLLETLKWEQRLETYHQGYGKAFFESRGWGDLHEGTFLHLPVPAGELALIGKPVYTFGGGGTGSAPKGTYGF
jgi:starch-binding outer membrane protein, SusD/RagB family